jgi:hypothetical protein
MQLLDADELNGRFKYNIRTLGHISMFSTGIVILCSVYRIYCLLRFRSIGMHNDHDRDLTGLIYYANAVFFSYKLVIVCSIMSHIPFFIWFYRAYFNLYSANVKGLNLTPIRAVLFFFLPLLNIHFAVVATHDLLRGSKHLASKAKPEDDIKNTPIKPLGIIMAVLLLIALVFFLSIPFYGSLRTPEKFSNACMLDVTCFMFYAAGGCVVISIVYAVTKNQTLFIKYDPQK